MTRKVLFIMGIGRSGSTLLDFMLSGNCDCLSLGEISKFPEIYRKETKSFKQACFGSTFWEDNFTSEELELLGKGLSNQRLNPFFPLKLERGVRELLEKDRVLNPYSLIFSKVKENVLIDSSKYVHWIEKKLQAREFKQGLIDAYIVHMVRDGRAVLNSYLRKYPKETVQSVSQSWIRNLKASKKLYQNFPSRKRMVVRYEELASDPGTVLQNICDLLDIKYAAEMIEYWKSEHPATIRGSWGTRSLILKYQGKDVGEKVRKVHGEHYQNTDFSIKLDLRWKKELSPEKLEEFNRLVGDLNKPYEWDY